MRRLRFLALSWAALACASAWPQAQPPARSASVPLVLAGGTVVDVTDWGRSAKDLPDAIVIIRDGRITDVGPRLSVPIPKNARVIDCTGKFIIPGLIDGFAGMNSQGQANANLYMGVTSLVASGDDRRGSIDFSANPSPHLYIMDSIGSTDNWSLLGKKPEWSAKLKEGAHPAELSPDDTAEANDRHREVGHKGPLARSQSHRSQHSMDHRSRASDGPHHLRRICLHALHSWQSMPASMSSCI